MAYNIQKDKTMLLTEHFYITAFLTTAIVLFVGPTLRSLEFISDTMVITLTIEILLTTMFSIQFFREENGKSVFNFELFKNSKYIKSNDKVLLFKFYIVMMTFSVLSFFGLIALWLLF